jgi:hypothetical protein
VLVLGEACDARTLKQFSSERSLPRRAHDSMALADLYTCWNFGGARQRRRGSGRGGREEGWRETTS